VIILRFGMNGRLATICSKALSVVHPYASMIFANRSQVFHSQAGSHAWDDIESLVRGFPNQRVLLVDASVDHTSIAAMVAHEEFKRKVLKYLNSVGALDRAIGFSSGITCFDATRIRCDAIQMLEYRRQKLAQQESFSSLRCPIYLPNLFTLVGPITYSGQGAAWAQVFKARCEQRHGIVLNEPHTRKAWVSEFSVLRTLLNFLSTDIAVNFVGPLVCGEFTLAGIAAGDENPIPKITYAQGAGKGWLLDDYLPPVMPGSLQSLSDELLRALPSL